MTGREHLIQRFLDQELSAAERVEFLNVLSRDESTRRRALELADLALAASRLPRPAVPAEFLGRVMSRTAPVREVPASQWRRLARPWVAPRMLRWNLASATAAASLVFVLLVGGLLDRQESSPPAATTVPTSAASGSDPVVLVRLVVVRPDARTVEVAGDFNGWDPERTPLQPAAGGAWTVTLPLEPGRYEYMFVVDGQDWVADPYAVEQHDDGFGSRNAVIDVRPARGAV